MNIPEQAIKAAGAAILNTPADYPSEEEAQRWAEYIARAALEAAAPFIAAQALWDTADNLGRMADSTDKSPYVNAGRDIIDRIRDYADLLEQP